MGHVCLANSAPLLIFSLLKTRQLTIWILKSNSLPFSNLTSLAQTQEVLRVAFLAVKREDFSKSLTGTQED